MDLWALLKTRDLYIAKGDYHRGGYISPYKLVYNYVI